MTERPPSSNPFGWPVAPAHPTPILAELGARARSTKQQPLIEGHAGDVPKVGFWLTPPDVMAKLQAEFDFNYDSCPFPRPAGFDGLKEPWGTRTYCNPPFKGAKMAWARKCVEEWRLGKTVVLILGTGNLSHVFDVMPPETELRIIPPFKWLKPDGSQTPSAYSAILFILRGRVSGNQGFGGSPRPGILLDQRASQEGRANECHSWPRFPGD